MSDIVPEGLAKIGAALVALVLVVVGLVVLWGWNHQHRALLAARMDAEAAHLALAHQTVEAAESKKQLQGSVADLLAQNAVLADAVAQARAAAPGAVPVSASSLVTSPVQVPAPLAPISCAQAVPVAPPGTPLAPKAPPACALSSGEMAWFKVDLIELQTREQNTLVAGTAELRALNPDRLVLGPAKFQSEVSNSASLAPAAAPRWGAEVIGQCQRDGCGLGAGVLLPPWPVLGLRLEARAGFLLGPAPSATAGLGVRW